MSDDQTSKIYTRGGDRGQTSLVTGRRVSKASARVAAYGDVDELVAAVGVALELARPHQPCQTLVERLRRLQEHGMVVAALLATDDPVRAAALPQLPPDVCAVLEREIDEMTAPLPELRSFVLPGGTLLCAQLHVCRTVCRRAERASTALAQAEPLDPTALVYLNRLSDWLFTAARHANHLLGAQDLLWRA